MGAHQLGDPCVQRGIFIRRGGLPAAIAGGVGIAGWIARNGPLVCLVGGLDVLGGVTLVGADRALASVV